MKRSEINRALDSATACFVAHGWTLPPKPRWDITDFGLGQFCQKGLVLCNLAEELEYCEKLMYAQKDMVTLTHAHRAKKEDIICRWGELRIKVWNGNPSEGPCPDVTLNRNGEPITVPSGTNLILKAGERVTLTQGIYHEFAPVSDECIIGEVSTANDDETDNYFADPTIQRVAPIIEDEPARYRLLTEID